MLRLNLASAVYIITSGLQNHPALAAPVAQPYCAHQRGCVTASFAVANIAAVPVHHSDLEGSYIA